MSSARVFDPSRRALLGGFGLALLSAVDLAWAQEEEEPTEVSIKGRIKNGKYLLNPVWVDAKDPKSHRYTFRAPSATVAKEAKRLTAYLPKELCIAALGAGAKPRSTPVQIHVSGGRTSPVTVVIPEGQNVQFINDDPFDHKLYDAGGAKGGMAAEETKPTQQRIWKPPEAGTYEIRDEYFPSIRTWIVVEPKAASFGYPKIANPKEFVVDKLLPGQYQLQAYFSGKPTGKPMPVMVKPAPALQPIGQPLVVAKKKDK